MMSLTPILLVSHVGCCLGWSWIHQAPHSSESKISMTEAELSHPDIEGLLSSNDALHSYQRKPDCFQDAMSLVKARCEESRMDEQERVHAAIGMTMCELATARHYSPPMECAAFAIVGYDPLLSFNPQAQAKCVDALSRSAQFWSSYSGYLREIPQLCFAFRRWIDIDIAKDIYRNITNEKSILLRSLMEREKNSRLAQRQWEKNAEDLRDVLRALISVAHGAKDTSDLLAMTVVNISQSLLKEVVNAVREIGQRDQTTRAEIMAEFHNMLAVLGHDHSAQLSGLLSSIQSVIVSEIDTVLSLIKDESLRNLDMATQLENRLGLLDDQLFVLYNSLQQFVGVVEKSSKLLEASFAQAQMAQAIHDGTMVSMTHLADSIDLLTQTTHTELEAINRTTSALTESLRRSATSDWLNSVVRSVFQLWPGIDSVFRTQSLQVVLCIANIVWYGTRFLMSLLTSAFVLINARRLIPSRPRLVPEDMETSFPPVMHHVETSRTFPEMDTKPVIANHIVRPRTRGLERTVQYRYSRIPDRLCRPSDENWWR